MSGYDLSRFDIYRTGKRASIVAPKSVHCRIVDCYYKVAADDVRVHTTDQADSDFRNQGYTKYAMYAKQQADELMEAFRNTDFFEPEHFSFSKVDPAYIIRKSMGRLASLSDIIA